LPAWLQYILQPCECRTMWEDNDTDALRRLRIFTNMSDAPPYIRTFTLHQRHQTCAFKSFHYCVNIVYTVMEGGLWQSREFIRLEGLSLFVLMKRRLRDSITSRSARGARVCFIWRWRFVLCFSRLSQSIGSILPHNLKRTLSTVGSEKL